MKAKELVPKMNKDFPGSVLEGAALRDVTVPRLSSGSFVFDLITGGGLPLSRLTVLHGDKSSGKSTFALRICGNFQKVFPEQTILYVDFENTYDNAWASNFLDTEHNFIVIKPDYGEQGIDMTKGFAVKTSDLGLIVVDSLASIIPTAEAEAGAMENPQIGLQVKQINRLIRGLLPPMTMAKKMGRNLSILCINQVRANMNAGKFGAQTSQPGGKYLGHVASLDCRFYAKEYKKTGDTSYAVVQSIVVDKNKVGLPKTSGETTLYLANRGKFRAGDLDENSTVLTYAKRLGIIHRDGATWYVKGLKVKGTKGQELTFPSLGAMAAALEGNPKLFEKIKSMTLKACLKNPVSASKQKEEEEQ